MVLLEDPQAPWIAEALRAGVRAVLAAGATKEELAAAIQATAAGLLVLHPQDAQPLLASAFFPEAHRAYIESLTQRETQSAADAVLGAGTRTEAVTIGLRQGLILL